MALTDKAKEVADTALTRLGEYGEKAAELAEQARERAPEYVDKAVEFAGQARERAPEYVDRAVELAGKAADATAAGVDKATGGRFHDRIDAAHGRIGETLDRARTPKGPGGPAPA